MESYTNKLLKTKKEILKRVQNSVEKLEIPLNVERRSSVTFSDHINIFGSDEIHLTADCKPRPAEFELPSATVFQQKPVKRRVKDKSKAERFQVTDRVLEWHENQAKIHYKNDYELIKFAIERTKSLSIIHVYMISY